MRVGSIMSVIHQYTGPICVLEEHLDHTILHMTVVQITFLLQEHLLDQLVHGTALAANIAAWATWPAVQHTQPFQVVVAPVTQLTHQMPAGAVLAQVALLE
jgi:hypothetical protein